MNVIDAFINHSLLLLFYLYLSHMIIFIIKKLHMMVKKKTFYVGSQKVYNAVSIDLKTLQFLIAYLYNVYKKIY